MSVHDEPGISPAHVASALDQVRVLQADHDAAEATWQSDIRVTRRLGRRLRLYRRLLRFRSVSDEYSLWPLGVMTTVPFAVGAAALIAATVFQVGWAGATLLAIAGVLLSLAVCGAALWYPATARLQAELPNLSEEFAVAEPRSTHSRLCLEDRKKALDAAQKQYERLREEHERQQRAYLQSVEYRRNQLFNANWKAMRSVEFELFLKDVFEALGCHVETTRVTGDQGVDLIVTVEGRRVAVQVKGYVNSVSNTAIQQAYAGMTYYDCESCMVVTNSVFTDSAEELAAKVGCTLVDEYKLRDFVMGNLSF